MHERHLFEYAVIRVVPQVEREEFLNVGIVLYCGPQKFLMAKFDVDEQRLRMLCSQIDIDELHSHLSAFKRICEGGKDGGSIGKLPLADRFRWLTATRSTIVQTSKVHPGLCNHADEKLTQLYQQLVEKI